MLWRNFPLYEERPEGLRQFKKRERPELELTIAQQVADLLSRHGELSTSEIDLTESPIVDEPKTFMAIELDEITFENDSELIICQFPASVNGFCVEPGAHSVTKEDQDGVVELSLTVWDPAIETTRRIYDARGKVVGRLLLQELYEVLEVVSSKLDGQSVGNVPPISTVEFPAPIIDLEFQAIMSQFDS